MADNYLEKRYAEVFGGGAKVAKHTRPSLDVLLTKNRSTRGYQKDYVVHRQQLEAMVAVNAKLASARNQQALRFHLVTKGPEADEVLKHIHMGMGLPELHLPLPGTEPEAFIVVATEHKDDANLYIDLGISVQSMLLKAVEMGLNGLIIRAFDSAALAAGLGFAPSMKPLCVLAVGRSAESAQTVPVSKEESLAYYRSEGVHFVPKIKSEDLIF